MIQDIAHRDYSAYH